MLGIVRNGHASHYAAPCCYGDWGAHARKKTPTFMQRAEAATTITLSPLKLALLIAICVGGTALMFEAGKPSSRRAALKQLEAESIRKARRAYEVSQ